MTMNFNDLFIMNFGAIYSMGLVLLFLVQNHSVTRKIKIEFAVLAGVVIVESIAESVEYEAGFMPTQDVWILRWVLSVVCYIFRPGIIYMIILMMLRDYEKLWVKIASAVPLAIGSLLLITSPFHELSVYFTPNSGWHTGKLGWFNVAMLIIYLTEIVIVGILRWNKHKWETIVDFLSIAVMILILVLNEYNIGVMCHSLAMALAVLGYYMYFQSQNHVDEVMRVRLEGEELERRTIEHMLSEVIETLSDTIDAKDGYTHGHSARVAAYSRKIAQAAGMDKKECDRIYHAGLLHDIGKISIDEAIINKPGRLTKDEYETIKTHTTRGAEILAKMEDMPYLSLGAMYHHERYDGDGYPNGVKDNEIPTFGRIIAVADAYDAMTSKRSYREPMTQAEVRQQIVDGIGKQFDPYYANLMLKIIDQDTEFTMREV